MARENEITDEDLFDVPELDGDDQHDDSDGQEGPPLDAEEVDPGAIEEREDD